LLVVIAIIAILAAILFPVFAAAREKARATTCASGMKQLGLAFNQYAQDYDEYYPFGVGQLNGQTNHVGQGWATPIYAYVKSTAAFACPDDPSTASPPYSVISYAYNYNILQSEFNSAAGPAVGNTYPQNKFNSPTVTVLLSEYEMPGAGANGPPIGNEDGSINNQAQSAFATPGVGNQCRVGSGCNFGAWGSSWAGGFVTGPISILSTECGGGGSSISCAEGEGNNLLKQPGATGAYVTYNNGDAVHSGGAMYLFVDGHVKLLQGTSVIGGTNASLPTTGPNGTGALTAPITATYSVI